MGEEGDSLRKSSPGDPAAAGIALGAPLDPHAAAYLDEQTRLARLQGENLIEQNAFELSHLRWRRLSDWMRVAWQVALCAALSVAALGLVAALAAALWAHDLVIDPFSVPSDIAAQGLTGEAAANQILARLSEISAGHESYAQGSAVYRDSSGADIKVVIPQTGISIGELNQYLRGWFGDEVHLSGQILRSGRAVSVTMRYGETAMTVRQSDGDLDKLMQKAAEAIFAKDRPLRFADYLRDEGRLDEAQAVLSRLAIIGPTAQRVKALYGWGLVRQQQSDISSAIDKFRAAIALDPRSAVGHGWLAYAEMFLDHEEDAHAHFAAALANWRGPRIADLEPGLAIGSPPNLRADLLSFEGDFRGAAAAMQQEREFYNAASSNSDLLAGQELAFLIDGHELAAARALNAEQEGTNYTGTGWLAPLIAASLERWRESAALFAKANAASATDPLLAPFLPTRLWPDWSVALARTGNVKGAEGLIAQTPPDCDRCALARGWIAMAEGNDPRAAYWFAAVAARAPHVPFADVAWGGLLMREGKLDAAVAKFDAAHRIAPHFAEPLEMWGEVLIAQNRSDLALAKFEEAARYAPNWGRLHLNWGEALLWSGDRDGARKQFGLARGLELSAAERAALVRFAAT